MTNFWRRLRLPFQALAAPAGPTWPESYEDATQWATDWAGDKGAGNWNRVAGGSSGSWSIKNESSSTAKTVRSNTLTYAKGEGTLSVDLKCNTATPQDVLAIRFAVSADGTTYYAIRFDPATDKIVIYRTGTALKTKNSPAQFHDTTWRTLTITWAASGNIAWTFGGDGDNVTDGTPLTGNGIGVNAASANAEAQQVDYWRKS